MRLRSPAELLICPGRVFDHTPVSCENADLALRLYWGRQRGLAVIFASDAMQCAQRCAPVITLLFIQIVRDVHDVRLLSSITAVHVTGGSSSQ